ISENSCPFGQPRWLAATRLAQRTPFFCFPCPSAQLWLEELRAAADRNAFAGARKIAWLSRLQAARSDGEFGVLGADRGRYGRRSTEGERGSRFILACGVQVNGSGRINKDGPCRLGRQFWPVAVSAQVQLHHLAQAARRGQMQDLAQEPDGLR